MSMTVEALEQIELDATLAPAPVLDHYIGLVRSSVTEAPQEVASFATALLLKLEHLARTQRVDCIDTNRDQAYLAPWLTIEPQPLQAAA